MKIVILRSAARSMDDGIWFYERQEAGLGGYFLDSIMADIRSLSIYAGIHERFEYGGYHRMVCSRFPFSVFYKIEESEIRVYAVLDNRQDPNTIRERLN